MGRLMAAGFRDPLVQTVDSSREIMVRVMPQAGEVAAVEHSVEALTQLFTGAKVVLNMVGPFSKLGPQTVEAALAAGITPIVELVPPRSLPRTSSGKLSRTKARNLYLSGEIVPFDIAA